VRGAGANHRQKKEIQVPFQRFFLHTSRYYTSLYEVYHGKVSSSPCGPVAEERRNRCARPSRAESHSDDDPGVRSEGNRRLTLAPPSVSCLLQS
jgi:hypothetical protein